MTPARAEEPSSAPFLSPTAGRDALIALSLANLCYLRVWTEILTYQRVNTYLMDLPPGPAAMLAAMTNVVLLAAVLWLAVTLVRRSGSERLWTFTEYAFLLFLAVPLNGLRAVMTHFSDLFKSTLFEILGTVGVLALGLSLAVIGLLLTIFFHNKLAAAVAAGLAILSPFVAVTFGQAVWKIAQYNTAEYANLPPEPMLPVTKPQRVVWIVADEWDYRLSFDDRNPTLALPAIDQLRAQTLFADHALPPGAETPVSLPAYLTGHPIRGVNYDGPRELQMWFPGSEVTEHWSQQPNVFQRAHDLGFNAAAVEWFHPTCRVEKGLASCQWWVMALQSNSMGKKFTELVPNQTRSLFESSLLSVFGQSLSVEAHLETYREILKAGIRDATNPNYGLVFIHLPVPHAPHGYDRRTGRFTLANSPIKGYTDSLALLDLTLRELREAMAKTETWDNSTVIITSDHPYRESGLLDGKSDPRIPWLLKMAHQRQGAIYSRQFNTIVTQDLLLAVLRGEVADAAAVQRWLDTK